MTEATVPAPTGIVTFVFTDIEGSTRLFSRFGERYVDLLERHNELLRSVWQRCRGHEVGTEGDAFLVAFAVTDDAIRAGAEAQRVLAAETWPDDAQVRIRIGIHSGLASPHGDGYISLAVYQASRVVAAAHGGQVLVSQDASDRVTALDGLTLRLLGRYRLRDFETPIRLYQLAGEGLRDAFPAVRAMPADGHNIVPEPTATIGRDALIEQVTNRVEPGVLVTLLGPGGVGKTRVAKEIGIRAAPRWVDGVWLVDLAGVGDPGSVWAAVADAVGVVARPGHERSDDVVDDLRAKRAMVTLDNCEHLLDITREVVRSLRTACPEVGVLATSREPLGLVGEVLWPVAPLDLPETAAQADAAAVLSSAAGRLFAERAAAARAGFEVDAANAATIAEICRRLDGLPLALELAAALLGVQSPAEILEGLEHRFQFLRSRDPHSPDRHRSLASVLDWSYQSLGEVDRVVFRRLSVFGATFSVDTATAAVALADLEPIDVPQRVWSLVDRSLIVADLTANATRYRLLETTRSYGRRRLDESGEVAAVAASLASSFLDRMGPWSPANRRWMGDVGLELDNLRALIPLVAPDQEDLAQTLACTIGRYHDASQTFEDGIEEVGEYVRALVAPTQIRVSLLTTLADLHLRTGKTTEAKALIDEAIGLRDELGAPSWDDVGVERALGEVARRSGDLAEAARIARSALERPLSDRVRPRMYNLLGISSGALGDLDTAYEAFTSELELNEAIGYEWGTTIAHGNLAEVALRLGDRASAARHQSACLELAVAQGSTAMVAFSLIVAARLAGLGLDWTTACRLHARGEQLLSEIGLALFDDDRSESDELLARAREALGEEAFDRVMDEGRDLDLPTAIELAQTALSTAAPGA